MKDGDVVSHKQTSEPGRTFGYSTSPVARPTRPNRGFVTMFTLTPAWRWCSAFVGATLLALGACDSRTGPRLRDEGKSVDELQKMLADADPEVQARGAFGLSRHGADARPAVPALIEALKRPTPLVRQNAALALGAIGPGAESAVPALTEALGDSEWAVRRQVALSLGEIGPAAKPALGELTKREADANKQVREAAKGARKKIGG